MEPEIAWLRQHNNNALSEVDINTTKPLPSFLNGSAVKKDELPDRLYGIYSISTEHGSFVVSQMKKVKASEWKIRDYKRKTFLVVNEIKNITPQLSSLPVVMINKGGENMEEMDIKSLQERRTATKATRDVVEVLREATNNGKALNIRQLSKETGLSELYLRTKLRLLEDRGIVKKGYFGRSAYYYLASADETKTE